MFGYPNMGMNGMMMNGMGMGMGMNNQINMIQMYNMLNMMMNQQINNNNNQNMSNQNMINQNNLRGIMPRNRQIISYDPYNNYNGEKYNVTFNSSTGFTMNLAVPANTKLKDLFKTFIQRVGLPEYVLGKYINFIYNALYVNPFEEKTLLDYHFYNNSKILVIDVSNLLGGNYTKKN